MTLRLIEREVWTILAVADHRGHCRVRKAMDRLEVDRPAEFARLAALLDTIAAGGPPRNEAKSRRLAQGVYELKTRGGVRVIYVIDEDRVIICTDMITKPKRTELRNVIRRAEVTRAAYFQAKRRHGVWIVTEDP